MIVYKITNKINGKVYIGQSTRELQQRWSSHCCDAKTRRANNKLHNAIKKYGPEAFEIEVLEKAETQEALDILEQKYIELYQSMGSKGYNLKSGGQSHNRYSKEARERMRNAKLGRQIPEEVRAKMSEGHKNYWHNNTAAVSKRRQQSIDAWKDPKYRDKIAVARKKFWSNDANRKVSSERAKAQVTGEHKRKISDAVKEALQKRETRQKLDAFYKTRQKKVIDSNGKVYAGIKEAATQVGCNASTIVKVLKGQYKTAGGLKWKYVDEENIGSSLSHDASESSC
jgi:group I intron endonuclease